MQPCAWHQDDWTMTDSRLRSSFCLPCTVWQFFQYINQHWSLMTGQSCKFSQPLVIIYTNALNAFFIFMLMNKTKYIQCITQHSRLYPGPYFCLFRGYWNALVEFLSLKMLDLYLYTLKVSILIIGHKSCNMLCIVNKLTLQKIAKCCDTCVFGQKSKNTTTTATNQT